MKYSIWFQLYNKKQKCTIEADNKDDAEYKLRGKIKINKIELCTDNKDDVVDVVDDLMGMFGMKK